MTRDRGVWQFKSPTSAGARHFCEVCGDEGGALVLLLSGDGSGESSGVDDEGEYYCFYYQ